MGKIKCVRCCQKTNDWSKNESSTCWRDYTFGSQTHPPAGFWLSELVSRSAWLSAAVSCWKGVKKLKDIWTIMSVEEQSYDGTRSLSVPSLFSLRTVETHQTPELYTHKFQSCTVEITERYVSFMQCWTFKLLIFEVFRSTKWGNFLKVAMKWPLAWLLFKNRISMDATEEPNRVRFSLVHFFALPSTSFSKTLVYNIHENIDINSPQGYDAMSVTRVSLCAVMLLSRSRNSDWPVLNFAAGSNHPPSLFLEGN